MRFRRKQLTQKILSSIEESFIRKYAEQNIETNSINSIYEEEKKAI